MEGAVGTIAVLLCCVIGCSSSGMQASWDPNIFSTLMYKEMAKQYRTNLFFSPLSVQYALAAAWMGSAGDTQKEMSKALNFSTKGSDKQSAQAFLNILTYTLKKNYENFTLDNANGIFVHKSYKLKKKYAEDLKHYLDCPVTQMDLRSNPGTTVDELNKWVNMSTSGKIKKIISKEQIHDKISLMILNSIYFKGQWSQAFDKKQTRMHPFHLNNERTVNTRMMRTKGTFGYKVVPELKVRILRLDYSENAIRMYILLPDEIEGLEKLESDIEEFTGELLDDDLKETEVRVTLPKFKLDKTYNFVKILQKMNINSLFDNTANLSRLATVDGEDVPLKVNSLVQRISVDQNEEGTHLTDASAQQGIGMRSFLDDSVDFTADHPFMYAITESSFDSVIFLGRTVKPAICVKKWKQARAKKARKN